MSKQRIHQYMEKHRLTSLFEDLMNKVLHDQPDDPIVYLIKSLYRKAAIPIPKDLKPGTLRRSSPERAGRRSKSPEKTSTSQNWAVGSGPDLVDRSYDKPWLSSSKKVKHREEKEAEHPGRQVTYRPKQRRLPSKSPIRKGRAPFHPLLSHEPLAQLKGEATATGTSRGEMTLSAPATLEIPREPTLEGVLQISPKPLTKRKKQKQAWTSDTKVSATTFDELFDEELITKPEQTRQQKDDSPTITKAWSKKVTLDDGEDVNFRSRGYRGPRTQREEEDPLAGEIMLASTSPSQESSISSSKSQGAKLKAEQHRRDLEKILADTDKVSLDSGFDGYQEDDVEDDAIELLEDPEDLQREGVTNISQSGYKLSKVLRHRQEEANVKLNINFQDVVNRQPSLKGEPYDEFYAEDFSRPPTGMSYRTNQSDQSPLVSDDDDDFESVSQVVGPRKPVWNIADSDNETYRVDKTETVPINRDAGLPRATKNPKSSKFSATLPTRVDSRDSMDDDNFFTQANKTWAPGKNTPQKETTPPDVRESLRSVRSQDGGWNIPDETEVSVTTAWSAQTSARPAGGPPQAY